MIVYEVTLRIERDIAAEFRSWFEQHVVRMLAQPGFESAEVFEIDDDVSAGPACSLCAQYRLRDARALDAYLLEHAAHMRAEGVERFGSRFSAQRRVLRSLFAAP